MGSPDGNACNVGWVDVGLGKHGRDIVVDALTWVAGRWRLVPCYDPTIGPRRTTRVKNHPIGIRANQVSAELAILGIEYRVTYPPTSTPIRRLATILRVLKTKAYRTNSNSETRFQINE